MSEGQVPGSYKRSMSRGIGLFFVSQKNIFIFFLFRQKDVLFEKDQKVCSFDYDLIPSRLDRTQTSLALFSLFVHFF